MNERPVVILTFANQQDAYLAKLKTESQRLNELLSGLHDRALIEVYREEAATVDNLASALLRFRERIAVFHYAGHAEGERLHFEGGGGYAGGLAEQLAQLPNLRLVFLNGCSTQGQVNYLLKLGVKAVIATAVPIDDGRAVEFAGFFYMSFAYHNSLEEAFRFAVGSMRSRYGGDFTAEVIPWHSGLVGGGRVMPWALYVGGDSSVLAYRLPQARYVAPPPPKNYLVNEFILAVLDPMIEANPRLEALLEGPDGEPIDERQELAMIIEHFPEPIGTQIRLLATRDEGMDTTSVARVKQLVSTYVVAGQLMFYAVLSQLWDIKRRQGLGVKLSMLNLLYLDRNDFNHFNFIEHLVDGVESLLAANQVLLVPELKRFASDYRQVGGKLYGACRYLEDLRSRVNRGDVQGIEADCYSLCANGEQYLAEVLSAFAFLVNYDLLTIRDIYLENPRYMTPQFNHFIGRLSAKVGDLTIGRSPTRPRAFSDYLNNASIMLTADPNDLTKYLNLSPFVIDKNAFGLGMTEDRATEQQLYLYAFRQGEEYVYLTAQHNVYLAQHLVADQLVTEAAEAAGLGGLGRRGGGAARRGARRGGGESKPNPLNVLRDLFSLLEEDLGR